VLADRFRHPSRAMGVASPEPGVTDAPSLSQRWLFGILALAGVAGAVLLSVLSGNPGRLPGVALGSPALLYVEKAAACFTAYLLALVVVVRAFDGELPSELRGLKYTVRESTTEAARGISDLSKAHEDLRQRIDGIDALLGIADPE
jgi:hypothetical protein